MNSPLQRTGLTRAVARASAFTVQALTGLHPRWLLRPTLIRRVFFALLIAFSAAWVVLIVFRYQEVRQDEDQATGLSQATVGLLSALAEAREPAEAHAMAMAAERMFNDGYIREGIPGRFLLQVWDFQEERMVYTSAAAGQAMLDTGRQAVQRINGATYHVLAQQAGRWGLRVAAPRLERSWLLPWLGFGLSTYVAIAFPVVAVPVWLAVSSGLRPLRQLSERIAARGADDLSPVGFDARHAELQPLVHALDQLLAQLRGKISREHAFVQEAAHELRTPMAVISAQAHVLAKAGDVDERQAAEERLDHAIARASHLVQQLLALARIDVVQSLAAQTIDLAQFVRRELAQFAPAARARGIELSLEAPDTLTMRVDAPVFQSVLSNLVDNALRYGRPQGQVAVSLKADAGMLCLSVVDDGPGIPEAHQAMIFERFYRGTDHDESGSGLGLAIVRQAAVRMGGQVVLDLGAGGCCFTVRIPIPVEA